MPGYTNAYSADTLDRNHPVTGNTDHVAYSVDGSTEFSGMARSPIGATGWAAATVANPAVKANANAITTAAATGSGSIGYTAIFSALTSGVQKTEWQAVTAAKTVGSGDQLVLAAGDVKVTLT